MTARGWWSLGEYSGHHGADLNLRQIQCAFCGEEGNFELVDRKQRISKAKNKALNYDLYKCNGCANLTTVFWSGSSGLHDYYQMPWPRSTTRYPKHWPADVGRYWMQAQRSLEADNWDAAGLMARSAIQLLLRHEEASGRSLKDEIDDLAKKGELPPIVQDWAHDVRILGNSIAHPKPGQDGVSEKDARDAVKFLRVLLTLMDDLPEEIKEFRARKG